MLPDGSVVGECYNVAVTTSLLVEIHDWMCNGATMIDVIDRLRTRTVPAGYTPHSWHIGILYIVTVSEMCTPLIYYHRKDRNTRRQVAFYTGTVRVSVPDCHMGERRC